MIPIRTKWPMALLLSIAGLGLVACGSSASTKSSSSGGGKLTIPLKKGGTFTLAPSIQAKVQAHQPINYVFSYPSCSIQGFSAQFAAGYQASVPVANGIYPLHAKSLCPPQPQEVASQQIPQIQALLNTNQIDCLSINPADSTSLQPLVEQALHKGIPTFTVGITTFGDELTDFTQVPAREGATAADTVLSYMKAHDLHFKTFAIAGSLPTQYWAQRRAIGFRQAITQAIPDATFVTTEKNMLNTTPDPAKTYDSFKTFLSGAGKNVDVIEDVDIGAGIAARASKDLGRAGKTFTIGWNDTPDQIAAIKSGTQIGLLDQDWPQQAAFGAIACATFLKTGKVLPNTQTESAVTKANLTSAQARLTSFKQYALEGLPR